jgi:hypothetical protein
MAARIFAVMDCADSSSRVSPLAGSQSLALCMNHTLK